MSANCSLGILPFAAKSGNNSTRNLIFSMNSQIIITGERYNNPTCFNKIKNRTSEL